MQNTSTFLLSLILFILGEAVGDPGCSASSSGRTINFSINTKKNQTGDWITTFNATKVTNGTSSGINLDVSHALLECDGKYTAHIMGVIKEAALQEANDRLIFHPKCGTNVIITNDGRSAEKINLEDAFNGVVMTNRPLKIKELFEVRLDKKNTKFSESIGMGVTTHSPASIDIPKHMNTLNSGTWLTYIGNVYRNGTSVKADYMKNPKNLSVGDRIGLMRNASGALHYLVNGIDQGPAASNVPHPIYGVFELYYNTVKITIVDALPDLR